MRLTYSWMLKISIHLGNIFTLTRGEKRNNQKTTTKRASKKIVAFIKSLTLNVLFLFLVFSWAKSFCFLPYSMNACLAARLNSSVGYKWSANSLVLWFSTPLCLCILLNIYKQFGYISRNFVILKISFCVLKHIFKMFFSVNFAF